MNGTGYEVLGGSGAQYTSIDLDVSAGKVYYGDPTQNGLLFRMDLDGTPDEPVGGPFTGNNFEFNGHVIAEALPFFVSRSCRGSEQGGRERR